MKTLLVAALISGAASSAAAQVNMQYNGQYNGQYSGQYNGQIDGRASKNEGLPPSAAHKGRTVYQGLSPNDCAEAQKLNPYIRPRMQARVDRACDEQYPP